MCSLLFKQSVAVAGPSLVQHAFGHRMDRLGSSLPPHVLPRSAPRKLAMVSERHGPDVLSRGLMALQYLAMQRCQRHMRRRRSLGFPPLPVCANVPMRRFDIAHRLSSHCDRLRSEQRAQARPEAGTAFIWAMDTLRTALSTATNCQSNMRPHMGNGLFRCGG